MDKPEIIASIILYQCPVKLKEPFIISLGKLEYADNVVVKIITSGGFIGFGECSPFQTIHGENSETCIVVGKLLANAIKGSNALDIENCSLKMDAVIYGNTSIKSAFDIAIHDIASQEQKIPLYQFLGGKNDKQLVSDYTVSISSPGKMADDAAKIIKAGFKIIKIKLGGKAEDDFQRMKEIRERIGYDITIRIDANQGWQVEQSIKILDHLHQYNIQHCEEPVSRKSFIALPALQRDSKIPIMADESCFDDVDAQRLIDSKSCAMINVKLGKSSGLFKAKKIAVLAEKADMKLQAGGFLESRLGFTATAHLALCSKQFIFFDFDTPLMFIEDLVTGGISYHEGGLVKVPDAIGLGATINDDVLKSLKSIEIF